jgi:hypothetical protein
MIFSAPCWIISSSSSLFEPTITYVSILMQGEGSMTYPSPRFVTAPLV